MSKIHLKRSFVICTTISSEAESFWKGDTCVPMFKPMYMVSHMVLHLLELPIWMLMLVFAMTPRTNLPHGALKPACPKVECCLHGQKSI